MKNKTSTRFALILLVMALILAMTACQSTPTTSGSTTGSSGSSTTAVTSAELDAYELDIVLASSERQDTALIEAEMNKITQAEINATVKFTFISFANWLQQTNLMIAGNEKIDILWTSSFFGFTSAAAQNQIIALDDLVNQYGSDIVEVLGQDILSYCRVGDSIYGIPSTRDMAADYGVILRKDLVEKYDLDLDSVEDMDDFTPIFQTLMENEPDMAATGGHSGSNTMVGLIAKGTFDILDNWFGVIRYDDPDMTVVNLYETPEYMDLCETVHDWYQAGYISRDAATSTASAWDQIKADKQASVFYSFKPGSDIQEQARTGKPMVTVSITDPMQATSNITVMMASIARTSPDPERAMMMINMWYGNSDIVNLFDCGIEGTHYVKTDDGFVTLPEGVESSNAGWPANNYLIGNNYLSHIWEGYPADLWEQYESFNGPDAVKSPALGFSYSADNVKTEVAAINAILLEYRAGLETGTLDPAVKLPEMIAKMQSAGMDTILADKQAQIDEFKQMG